MLWGILKHIKLQSELIDLEYFSSGRVYDVKHAKLTLD